MARNGELEQGICRLRGESEEEKSAERSPPADIGKNGQLIALGRDLVQFAVARVDHGHADLIERHAEGTDDRRHRGPSGKSMCCGLQRLSRK